LAARFGLAPKSAKSILREVCEAVMGWRQRAKALRLPATTIAAYASAFEHAFADEVRRLLRL
ncbi:MAG: type II toxin-antitoxin system HipA family toxin, partial [Planctomycetota bacterium]